VQAGGSRAGDAPPAVSVVICTYTQERRNDLVAAVASALEQTLAPREVIVVVDHNDTLLARVRTEIREATVVASERTSGLSGSRNAGVDAASGSIVAFLDDDAEASREWLERLTAPFSDPAVLGTGGVISPRWLEGRPRWFPDEFQWVVGCTYAGMPERDGAIRNPIGANMAVRRDVVEALGGFRAGTGASRSDPLDAGAAGTDETEFAIRAQQSWPERKWVYVPSAAVTHRVPASRATWSFFRARCRDEGRAKAALVGLRGGRDALASERTYVRRTLPRAVSRGIADALLRRDPGGLGRAGAVIVGLVEAAMAYARARASVRLRRWAGT
jgi:glycosyltransferase involved in cell wall biosynthesis